MKHLWHLLTTHMESRKAERKRDAYLAALERDREQRQRLIGEPYARRRAAALKGLGRA